MSGQGVVRLPGLARENFHDTHLAGGGRRFAFSRGWHDDRLIGYEPFASGWLQGESAWGRPADVQELPDGSMLVSDDHAGAIYRVTYRAP